MFMDSSEIESNSKLYAKNGILFLTFTVLLFFLLLLIIFLHTFRHSCFPIRRRNSHRRHHRHRHTVPASNGIHPSLLTTLPTFTHPPSSPSAGGGGDSCAVCMSEFVAGEEGRVLPICRHAFHSQCIDAWFGSHSSCPLCRKPVHPVQTGSVVIEPGLEKWFPEPIWCPKKKPLEMELEMEKVQKMKNSSYCINIMGL
ncbi:hypothetical protein HN51_023376 [Arachis hypogaea]|uniref:RING-type domain-containing protein n=1 Tax=Arachis hypogaea TaxID=3818 RepID=A0A445E5F1_ARAHY|nr:RING-H2 finger protein ATL2 [Arachis hypogaea]QHO26190.1 RING-H2 finger protein [Arachis hypogaea]RYR70682.1 hypothetical protein Ahy_A02g005008 [Arachis hypogaea]